MNLPILMYHQIAEHATPGTDLVVTRAAFEAQMHWLKSRGFRTISLSEVAERPQVLPARSMVITFDDAFACVKTLARPILEKLGFKATVFAVSGTVGKYNVWDQGQHGIAKVKCLKAAELKQLAKAGWEIGSHGATHRNLTQADVKTLRTEVLGSKRVLEQMIGRPVKAFCYPYGALDLAAKAAVVLAGYSTEAAISPGTSSVTADLFALRRVYVKPTDTLSDFQRKLSNWYLTFRAWRKR